MKPGRNDPCPCGSRKKYKHCCGLEALASSAPRVLSPHEIGALVAMLNQDRLGDAEREARTLLTIHPDAGMLWKILSVALVRQDKDPLPALMRAAELLPQDAEAHSNLGSALRARGQWQTALASLYRALELQPRDVGALLDAAAALRALGRAGESPPLYRQALAIQPRSAVAHNDLGNALLELGQTTDAVACYGLALEIKPDDAHIHCNLGNALRQLGQLQEAITCSQRAITLEPGLSMAHNNLGLALAALGQRQRAVASYRRALALNPRYVEALNNLGNVLHDLGERREALSLYRQAIELDPKRADSHFNLGNVLLELRRLDDAAGSFRRALALQPDYPQAHVSLGTALRMQGRATEAQACCQAALALAPNGVEALSLLGELRADRGRFAEARQLFQQVITIDPGFTFAFCSMAAHRKMTNEDTAWLKGAEALAAKPLPLGQEISLRYALGKYFDDVRHYDEAFSHYRQANELTKRYGGSYDRAKLTRRVGEIISGFDAAFMRECHTHASASELPVFIIGMPRSGTSLAEQILASHPEVFGAGELRVWGSAFAAFEAARLKSESGANLIPGMARDYLERVAALSGPALRLVDKMPANFLYAGLIHAAFPRARIIHMQRHPLDTCLSIYFQNFFNMGPYANDFDNLAHYYGEYVRIMNHWRTVLPAATLLEVPYEALIEDQESWTRRMLDFIGLPWDPKCMDFHQTDRVVITASKWQVRQKITAASVGRWRNYERYVAPLQHLLNLGTQQ
jgi:tetratricopeptide (TPR) repeat protein